FRSGNLSDCVCSCNHCAGLGKFSRSERSQIDDDSGGCWYDSHHGLISLCTECLLAIDYALLYGDPFGLYSKCDSIDCFSSPERKERLGTRNISNRSYRRKLDRAFYGWCFSTVVWYEECIYHHRGRSFDHIAANDLFG